MSDRYWTVHLSTLDRLNGPANYQFPTQVAAERFARNCAEQARGHRWVDVDGTPRVTLSRDIHITAPSNKEASQ